jgi:hypothetical protein
VTASDRLLGDGASPERDDRTWLIRKRAGAHIPYDAPGASIIGPETQPVEVKPASELARVQDERDQAREALKELSDRITQEAHVLEHSELPVAGCVGELTRVARGAALAASGVTEKGDGTDG